jgi:hypothetical protein
MPQLSVEVPHALGQQEAARRLKEKIGSAREMFGEQVTNLQEQWDEDVFRFAFDVVGMSVAGTMAVEPQMVKVAASLPLAAIIFRGTIEQRLRDEIGVALA